MTEQVVVNEASLPFKTLDDCNRNIENIFNILHEARLGNLSFCRTDGYEGDWGRLNYADGFEFGFWLSNIDDNEKIRQVKSVLANVRCPLRSLSNTQDGLDFKNISFYLDSDDSFELYGLGYAHEVNKYSFSFASDDIWISDTISIMKMYEKDGNANIEEVTVKNIASMRQLVCYLKELEQSRKDNKDFLCELDTKDNEYFPNLLFTESVLKSFRSASLQTVDFFRVIDVLGKLDKAILTSVNISELSENSGLSITGESTTTMGNRVLVRMRTFKHPENGKQVFEDHVKNFPNAKRMHILADFDNKKVCIGYFGPHLKTSNS